MSRPSTCAPRAPQAIAKVGGIELANGEWRELVPLLLNHIPAAATPGPIKHALTLALTYLCEEIVRRTLQRVACPVLPCACFSLPCTRSSLTCVSRVRSRSCAFVAVRSSLLGRRCSDVAVIVVGCSLQEVSTLTQDEIDRMLSVLMAGAAAGDLQVVSFEALAVALSFAENNFSDAARVEQRNAIMTCICSGTQAAPMQVRGGMPRRSRRRRWLCRSPLARGPLCTRSACERSTASTRSRPFTTST
jgi:hypothetical protein